MSRQDDILGPHPSKHPVFGTWLDYEDKESTETSCVRTLSEKSVFDEVVMEPFAKCLIDFHYSPASIKALKKRFEKLGFKEFSTYYAQSRKLPRNVNTRKGNAVEVLMTEYSLAAIDKPDLTYAHRFRYNPNVDQSMKGDDMLIVDFSDESRPTIYIGEAKFRKTVDKAVLEDVKMSLAKDKMPLSLTFLRDRYENVDGNKYEKLDDTYEPYNSYNYEAYTNGNYFKMGGKEQKKSFTLGQDSSWDEKFANFNIEGKYNKLTFKVGKMDGAGNHGDFDVKIYSEGQLV